MKRIVTIISIWAVALGLGLVSCTKSEQPEVEPAPDATVTYLEDHVDLLTRSLTAEDLQDVGLFVRLGDTPGTLYVDITKGGISYVKGEIGRVSTQYGGCYTLNLLLFDAIPVAGNIFAWPLAKAMLEVALYSQDPQLLAEAVAKVNQAVDVQVMDVFDLQYLPVVDPESGETSLQWCLYNGEVAISIQELLAMLGLVQ